MKNSELVTLTDMIKAAARNPQAAEELETKPEVLAVKGLADKIHQAKDSPKAMLALANSLLAPIAERAKAKEEEDEAKRKLVE
jgi:hypothetical protein